MQLREQNKKTKFKRENEHSGALRTLSINRVSQEMVCKCCKLVTMYLQMSLLSLGYDRCKDGKREMQTISMLPSDIGRKDAFLSQVELSLCIHFLYNTPLQDWLYYF